MPGLQVAADEDKIDEFIRTFDEDGDGMVSLDEFTTFFGKLFDSVIVQGLIQD